MISRTEKVKAGIFVLVSVALLLATVVLIAGFEIFKTTKTYYVLFPSEESVTGLEESSVVRYSGVPVGRVSQVGFAPNSFPRIQVAIEVEPGIPIHADTIAQLKPQGITGVFYIDLEGGTRDAGVLEEGGVIAAKPSVTADLLKTLADIKSLVENLNAMLIENRDSIGRAVSSIEEAAEAARSPIRRLDETLRTAKEFLDELRGGVGATISSAREAIEIAKGTLETVDRIARSPEIARVPGQVNEVLDKAVAVLDGAERLIRETEGTLASTDLKRVVDALEGTLLQLSRTGKDVAETVAQVRMGVKENRGALLRIVYDFRSFSNTMKVLAEEIREDPSRLLFGRRRSTREEAR